MSAYEDLLGVCVGSYDRDDEAKIAEHLDFIEDVDLSEPCYSFDLLRIYVRRHDGMLLWATDSGCSCPSPFEGVTVADLRESTSATLLDSAIREWQPYSDISESEVRKAIGDAIRVAKTRGAR